MQQVWNLIATDGTWARAVVTKNGKKRSVQTLEKHEPLKKLEEAISNKNKK